MKKILFLMVAFLAINVVVLAQNEDDALRYLIPNGSFGPRAGAMGTAFYGLSDDISALHFNPAGLAVIGRSEISLGFGYDIINIQTNKKDNLFDTKSTNAYLTNLGISSPFKNSVGTGSIAILYNLDHNFDRTYQTSFFNPDNSFVFEEAKYGYSGQSDRNISYYLWLSDKNGKSSIGDSLYQESYIDESGGIHSLSGGTGFDISDMFSVGFALVCKFGNYNYSKEFIEVDRYNLYQIMDTVNYSNMDFYSLKVNETIKQSFFGISGTLGMQAKFGNNVRAGLTIKLPTAFTIEEHFSRTAEVTFDGGSTDNFDDPGSSSYSFTTPFVFAGGLSANYAGLTLTFGFEYSDATQLEFTDPSEMAVYNRKIQEAFVSRNSIGGAVEYKIPATILIARAGYNYSESPYKNTEYLDNMSLYSLGLGILMAPNLRLDLLYRYTNYSESLKYYYTQSMKLDISPSNFQIGITYRY